MSTEDRKDLPLEGDDVSPSSEGERVALLASVMSHQAEREEAQAALRPKGPKPLFPQLAALAGSTFLAVYVWFISPSWLGPHPIPPPPLAEEESAARFASWIAVQQVEDFQEKNGRIPGSQEVGPLPPGVRYQRLDARRYAISGQGERVEITYSSGEPQDDLLGAVEQLLSGVEGQ